MSVSEPVLPNPTHQLRYEAGSRPRYAVVALVAGILLVASAAMQLAGPHTTVEELTLDLITAHRRFPLDLIGAVVDCAGLITLAAMLGWLHGISKARNVEIRDWIRWMTTSGAVLSGLMAVAYAVVIAIKASQFVSHGTQSYLQANTLTQGGLIQVVPLLAQLGSLLLTAGFIWTALNAMRVGLVSRFMGYLGVFAGLLVLFPIGSPVPVVQGFWLVAMAVLIAGRWPNGNPPAWQSGIAEPWTPMSQPRERPSRGEERRPSRRGRPVAPRASEATTTAKAAPTAADDAAAAAARTRATTPKRKRKRRH